MLGASERLRKVVEWCNFVVEQLPWATTEYYQGWRMQADKVLAIAEGKEDGDE